MKQGEAVFLHSSPEMRGNISLVGDGWFDVTWHPFLTDRPEAYDLKVNIRDGQKRTRVRYRKGDASNIGFGEPS
jgi:hypothetical protein